MTTCWFSTTYWNAWRVRGSDEALDSVEVSPEELLLDDASPVPLEVEEVELHAVSSMATARRADIAFFIVSISFFLKFISQPRLRRELQNYPLREPIITPLTKYFCMKMYRMTAGPVEITMQQYLATSALRTASVMPLMSSA